MSARDQIALHSVRHLLVSAAAQLRVAGVEGASRDARLLMSHALNIPHERLILDAERVLTDSEQLRFEQAIAARAARQPVAQILGRRAFFGREFEVTSAVLDPRPETETLVEQGLTVVFSRLLDLGTGSGAVILSLLAERPGATGLAVDQSRAALDVAARNIARLELGARVELRLSDWFSDVSGHFDLIVSNPPYISAAEFATLAPELRNWEPRAALVPAQDACDGLSAYRVIIGATLPYLAPGGWLMVEIGAGQGEAVAELFAKAGFESITLVRDLDSRARVLRGQNPHNRAPRDELPVV